MIIITTTIINNYVEKHGQNMNKELKKKEKVLAICDKLKGREKNYFSQLVKNYYNSNHMSHISEIFKNLEAKHIIGIGKNDDVINRNSPILQGLTYGISSSTNYSLYDGIIKGITGTISGSISDTESNSSSVTSVEVIDGNTYNTLHLN